MIRSRRFLSRRPAPTCAPSRLILAHSSHSLPPQSFQVVKRLLLQYSFADFLGFVHVCVICTSDSLPSVPPLWKCCSALLIHKLSVTVSRALRQMDTGDDREAPPPTNRNPLLRWFCPLNPRPRQGRPTPSPLILVREGDIGLRLS